MRQIALSLPTGSNYGWAVCGNALRKQFVGHLDMEESRDDTPLTTDLSMLHAIEGTSMLPFNKSRWSTTRNVGYCFIEESELAKRYAANAGRYFDHVIAGSSWCKKILIEAGVASVSVAIQGVDHDLFRPGRYATPNPDRFTIFSGGKAEWRKGTDVAMKAIGIMMQRHKDVYAVGSWWNAWARITEPEPFGIDMDRLNGDYNRPIQHDLMPDIFSDCDLGLFPNRVEGGTNLVMMEFMACGKPVIAMAEHGHGDVVTPCLVRSEERVSVRTLSDGRIIQVAKYWEPDLDEIVERLEWAYQNRDQLPGNGIDNAITMQQFTWERCAEDIHRAVIGE